jgi:hypothetical protein
MATFEKQIWSLIYQLKKKTFIYPPKDIESLQKSTTSKEGIVAGLIAVIALMVMTPRLDNDFGIVFVFN